jgi:hypothetical protein
MEGKDMADDRMKNDDLDRNMGGTVREDMGYGQQSPGRKKEDDDEFGQRSGRQGTSGTLEDDDDDFGSQQGGSRGGREEVGRSSGQDR